jgi:hypothetical protein
VKYQLLGNSERNLSSETESTAAPSTPVMFDTEPAFNNHDVYISEIHDNDNFYDNIDSMYEDEDDSIITPVDPKAEITKCILDILDGDDVSDDEMDDRGLDDSEDGMFCFPF